MRVDRDAAAVVVDGQEAIRIETHLDPGGVAGHGLVHGVVDHLGEEMVQCLLVGAADVHAGAAADGLQAFEDFDEIGAIVVGRIAVLAGAQRFIGQLGLELSKQVT